MKHIHNKYMSHLTSTHSGKRALYSQAPGFTLIGLTWETCLFFNQSLWPREWDMVIGQIWEMCSSLDMERQRRWFTPQTQFKQRMGEQWSSKENLRSQKQEIRRPSRQKACEYVGSGGEGVNPKVKVQSRKGHLWGWYFKTHWVLWMTCGN